MNKRLYVDFHILQTVPPSCINRDDTGSPKTAVYGGVTRARVSSQAWKHAMRAAFAENARLDVGKRTKKVADLVKEQILALAPDADADKLAKKALENAGIKFDEKSKSDDKVTKALFFMSTAQAKALAELAVAGSTDKKEYQKALGAAPSMDMALFGRMVADDPSLNYDAAAQVAHSISTHAVQNEYDYFTAVDDCQAEDNAGAGHLGTVEYNSSTLYRYATVNVMELAGQLGAEQAAETVRDALWERVCQNLKNGQATMVFTTAGEQRMDFRTHNTTWEMVDFDGIKLMRRPLPQMEQNQLDLKPGFSKAAQWQAARKAGRTQRGRADYTVIDLETTGLKAASDAIIEYGALRVRDGVPVEELTMLVCGVEKVPAEITALTGLSAAELQQGTEPREALQRFLTFLGKDPLVGHNIAFDLEFLRMACKQYGFPILTNHQTDLAQLARRKLSRVANYKLATLAQHFQLAEKVEHRALPDCRLIQQVYCKLKETAVQ